MFRMLVAFYRFVPFFKAVEQLKNLHVAYEVLPRGSFNSPVSFGLCFLKFCKKKLYVLIVSYLDIMNASHTLLFTWGECVRLNDCGEVSLTEDMREHVQESSEKFCCNLTYTQFINTKYREDQIYAILHT
jgi:hypothetical protein